MGPFAGARVKRRLPKWFEKEFAKFLSTLGFAEYGGLLWDLANAPQADAPEPAAVPTEIVRQIVDQARHDPCVLSAGVDALARLPQIDATTLDHAGVDVAGLFRAIDGRFDAIVMIAHQADVTALAGLGLEDARAPKTLVIVLEEMSDQVSRVAPRPATTGPTWLFWRDHCRGAGADDPRLLAMFAHALGPATILVGRTKLAYQMIARFGRALGPFHRFVALVTTGDLAPAWQGALLRHIRAIVPYAEILADNAQTARSLSMKLGVPAQDMMVLGEGDDVARRVFGAELADRRSQREIAVTERLLGTSRPPSVRPVAPAPRSSVEVSVVLVCHREGPLTVPALASLGDLLEGARAAGLSVEARAVLDCGDAATAALLSKCAWLDGVTEVAFGDPGSSRNAGAAAARGRYCAFLDGDDLWGASWLTRAFAAATEAPEASAVWHPEYIYLFHEADADVTISEAHASAPVQSCYLKQGSSAAPDFDARALLLDNLWSANAFALREIFLDVPYRASSSDTRHGIEDWRWNLETLGLGIQHRVVPDTVHIIRVKDGDSMSKRHEAGGLLPILA